MFIIAGRELHNCIHKDYTAAKTDSGNLLTLDHLTSLSHIKKSVDVLEEKLDRIQSRWSDRERHQNNTMKFEDIEHAIKTVSYLVMH